MIVVDKVENSILEDKFRITINYQNIYKKKPGNYINLASKYINFVNKPHLIIYLKLDLKYYYFIIKLYPNNKYILAFTVLHVQPTQIIQGSTNSRFDFAKFINIILSEIPNLTRSNYYL